MSKTGNDKLFKMGIEKGKLARFIASLRDFGMEIRYAINEECQTNNNQFVVASVVSVDEISDMKHTYLVNCFNRVLEKEEINLNERYFREGRIAVLMTKRHWHCEARLLDPYGNLWETLVEDVTTQDKNFLKDRSTAKMRKDLVKELHTKFEKEHGQSVRPVLVIYSHIIPCTNRRHECARLIEKFAKDYDGLIIVAYDVTHPDINTEMAEKSLTKCENVYFCRNRNFRPYINDEVYYLKRHYEQSLCSNKYSSLWTAEEGETYDQFDILEIFKPKFGRMYRREKGKDKRQLYCSKERAIPKPKWKRKIKFYCDEI